MKIRSMTKPIILPISLLALFSYSLTEANTYIYEKSNGTILVTDKLTSSQSYTLKHLRSEKKISREVTKPQISPESKTISKQNNVAKLGELSSTGNSSIAPTKTNSKNTISAPALGKTLTIRSCDYDAGAICSLKWNNKEFIDDYDHGRQLQSASSFDGLGEAFNPTEAGGSETHYGKNPSDGKSVLLDRRAIENELKTYSQMAFWNPVNGVRTSSHTLNKHVIIGYDGLDNVIEYLTQFNIPSNEHHTYGVFEAVTAYMPRDFSTFWAYDHKNRKLNKLVPATFPELQEQNLPIIASTANQQYAIGIYSPDTPQSSYPTIGYGAFLLGGVPKWNNVFRVSKPKGSLHFRSYVIVGTVEDVKRSMSALHSKFK